MQKIAKFIRVSKENFASAMLEEFGVQNAEVDEVNLPKRATTGSAGYDFYSPASFTLAPGETVKVPTGIRANIENGWVLMIFPRSGLGFKYRLQLDNTVGVIDSDYFGAKNEGHIFVKITNDGKKGKILTVNKGEAFCQGVFLPFGITEDDAAEGVREGGFGSTTK
ncbi:MAG: deoxyuridine 5'-triphosphate nucleotidohydrolase [Clostridiales bacterium]|nr:deoxyuridine 5'-triphosphate nucleotidohydrolase [Clostridiales bacterium]